MKLTVQRSQSVDAKRTIEFRAQFQLELTPQETDQINRYAQTDRILGYLQDICPGTTVKQCISGLAVYQNTNVVKMLAVEAKVKADVENLATYIDAADSYDGVDVLVSTE